MSNKSYYALNLCIDSNADYELFELYRSAANKNNNVVEKYFNSTYKPIHFDAGFDLFCPERLISTGGNTIGINQCVKTSMSFIQGRGQSDGQSEEVPVGYYLYPRSSTGSKTPLRMSNSVGIIDSGYRGHITAYFDNILSEGKDYIIEKHQRLVQICPPNLSYPLYVYIVETLDSTERGVNGFGSSGM
jgi:dUTP pyrophosphatase